MSLDAKNNPPLPHLPVGQQRIAMLPEQLAQEPAPNSASPEWSDSIVWDNEKKSLLRYTHGDM
jgi:hypothetical protein